MKAFSIPLITIAAITLYCCSSHQKTSPNRNQTEQIDSIIIAYSKVKWYVLAERAGYRRLFFLEEWNASIPVIDTAEFYMLCRLIGNLRPRDQKYVGEEVPTRIGLLVYKKDHVDSLVIAELPPPRVQVKEGKYIDCICDDSLLCQTVWDLLAQKDSIWLNECRDGRWYKAFWAKNKEEEQRTDD